MSKKAAIGTSEKSAPGVLRPGRAPLVGRLRELAAPDEVLGEVRAGRPAGVLLSGEPGIGKNRLLDEFPAAGHASDLIVLRGGATQAEGIPPYLPPLEVLGEYVMLARPDDLRRGLGAGTAVLARLLPEIAARLGESPESLYRSRRNRSGCGCMRWSRGSSATSPPRAARSF